MFLSKKEMRPVGLGSFCTIPDDLKNEMKQKKNYIVERSQARRGEFVHLAETDVLYVVDNKVFDTEKLLRVVPISFDQDGYFPAEKVILCAQRKKSFTVDKSKLVLLSGSWKGRESVLSANTHRVKQALEYYNHNYNLYKKNIQLTWESN